MKKTLFFAAALALAMASCGNKTQNAEAQADSTEVATDSAAVLSEETQATVGQLTDELTKAIETKDGKAISTTLTTLQSTYKQLVEAGKLEEAKAYGEAIKTLVADKAEDIKGAAAGDVDAIASLVEAVKGLPTSAETTAEEAKAAVENVATTAVDDAKNAAKGAVKEADEQAKKAVDDAKQKANEKVAETKQKANEKVTEAKQKAKDDAKAAVNKATDKALKGLGL